MLETAMALWHVSYTQLEREMTERQLLLMIVRAQERLEEEAESYKDRPREKPKPQGKKRSVHETVLFMMGEN